MTGGWRRCCLSLLITAYRVCVHTPAAWRWNWWHFQRDWRDENHFCQQHTLCVCVAPGLIFHSFKLYFVFFLASTSLFLLFLLPVFLLFWLFFFLLCCKLSPLLSYFYWPKHLRTLCIFSNFCCHHQLAADFLFRFINYFSTSSHSAEGEGGETGGKSWI